jgi:PAS domain S-box-containing protein
MLLYFGLLFVAMLILTSVIRIYGIPFTSFMGEYSQRRQEFFHELELIADLKKTHFVNWLDERIHDAQTHATNPLLRDQIAILRKKDQALQATVAPANLWNAVQQTSEFQTLSEYFQIIQRNNPVYSAVQLIQPDGQILLSTDMAQLGTQFLELPLLTTRTSRFILTQTSNKQLNKLIILHPVYTVNATELQGWFILQIKREALEKTLQVHHSLYTTDETFLINDKLDILTTHPTHSDCSCLAIREPLLRAMAQEQAALFTNTDCHQQPLLVLYRPLLQLGNTRWGIVLKVDADQSLNHLKYTIWSSLLVSGSLSLLLGLGLTFSVAYRLSRPLHALSQTILKVQTGNLAARAIVYTRDEVGLLATIFNTMLERVQYTHSGLEQLVNQRTTELHESNANLAVALGEMQQLNQRLKQEVAIRAQIEAEIRQKQREQNAIFDAVPAFIWHKNNYNRVLWMNKAAANLCDIVPHQAPYGCPFEELFATQSDVLYQDDLRVIATGEPQLGLIHQLQTIQGKQLWAQMDIVPYFNEEKQVIGVIVSAVDISARIHAERALKDSEQCFKAILHTAVDGIVMINVKGEIQFYNPSLAKMFGYHEEELHGANIRILMPKPHSEQHDAYIKNYLHTGKNRILGFGREIVGQRKDNSIFPIFLSVSELTINNERMFTGIISDITQLKQAQRDLEASKAKLEIQNKAYSRFVPREFLSFLGKDSIAEVQLGDQVQREMTVLFSDIRSFTQLSEKMTPAENFRFINAYLGKMEPVVKAYKGFIDKYIGDSVMALFPDGADDAVCGAIAMLQTLEKFNEVRVARGEVPIAIGIGIHTGTLMLGTIGGENRMDGTVISDAVNLASRVEDLTKIYGASLLITEHTYNRLIDVNEYAIRLIDKVKVKGKTQPVIVFEVLDGEAIKMRDAKLATLPIFTEAFAAYQRRNFEIAERLFSQCLEQNPQDQAACIYLKRARHLQQLGNNSIWDGVSEFGEKEYESSRIISY